MRSELTPEKLAAARAKGREWQAKYRRDHPDRVRATKMRSDARNAGRIKVAHELWYASNRDVVLAQRKEHYHANKNDSDFKQREAYRRIKRRYGLSALEYEMMKTRQNGKCVICGIEPKMLFVDHDHETGQVRELLCPACNGGVRKVEKLRAYIAYLEKHDELQIKGAMCAAPYKSIRG